MNKGVSIQQIIEDEKFNNFKLIRLVAACMVIFYHACGFTNEKYDALSIITDHATNFSYVGLSTFFFLSGLLVTQSLYYSTSWKNFLWKRFLRIYPAAWLVILSCMFILGPLVTSFPLNKYFTDPLFYNYAKGLSLIKIGYLLPGVFLNSPLNPSVNAPLWSINFELKLYLALLVFYAFKFPFKKIILAALIVVAVITDHFFYDATEAAVKTFSNDFVLYPYVDYAPYFLIGVLCFNFRNSIFSNFSIALLALGLCCLSIKFDFFFIARLIVIPALVLYISSLKPSLIKKITPKPDLSYGLYVFAFPVQQLLSQTINSSAIYAWQMTLLCILATLPLALFSWYMVEKKALSLKSIVK